MNNTQRTIIEVFEIETGEIIDADSFFNQEEGIIFNFRRQQQEAAEGFETPKFKCIYCDQLIRINGKGSGAGKKNFYFSHLSNSEYCDIKLVEGFNEAEKQERRYAVRRESKRHKELKHFIYEMLLINKRATDGVKDAFLEQTHFHSTLDQYKRPDIFATYNNISIAFEVQLSTIFLDIIIGRDKFYAEHNIFIIWIFNLLNEEQEWQRVMEKDIYYANKRNAFVLDNEAIEISKENNRLFFHCYWQQPVIEDEKITTLWNKKLITLDELKYDYANHKVYYYDSDADFLIAQQSLNEKTNSANETILELYKTGQLPHTEFKEGRRVGWKYNERILIPCEYSELKHLGNGFVRGQKRGLTNEFGNDKWGLIHIIDGVLSHCMFDYICEFKEGFARVIKNTTSEYVNDRRQEGNYYKIIEGISYHGNRYRIGYRGLYGIINMKGEIVIALEYDYIKDFSNFKAISQKGGKWGIIDERGNILIPFEFDEIKNFKGNKSRAQKEGKWGFIDEQGNVIVPFEIQEIEDCEEEKMKAMKNGKWGIIDEQGNIIIPFEFDEIKNCGNGKMKAMKDGKWGFIDEHDNIITLFEFEEIENCKNGKMKAIKNSKWGIIDEQGNIIIPFEFEKIENCKNGKMKAMKNGKWGFIDEQGKVITPFQFDICNELNLGLFNRRILQHQLFKVQMNNKWGIIDKVGNLLLSCEFEEIEDFVKDIAKIKKDSKFGLINLQGTIFVPCEFEEIEDFNNDETKIKKDGKWGVIDKLGNILVSCGEFDKIELWKEKFIAQRKGKWGYIDKSGKIVNEFIYNKKELLKIIEHETKRRNLNKIKLRSIKIAIKEMKLTGKDAKEIEHYIDFLDFFTDEKEELKQWSISN